MSAASGTACGFEQGFRLCSFTCTVRSDVEGLGELVDRYLAPFRADVRSESAVSAYVLAANGSGAFSLEADGEETVRGGTVVDAFEYLLWELSQKAIASVSSHLALHAGAVSWRGAGVVLPAPSGSGKSTLTAGLTAAGCDYLSDELALVDLESGTLHPFPRPLWMSQTSIGFLPGLAGRLPPELGAPGRLERHVPPDALRPRSIGGPCELRYVIFPEHVPGATTTLEPMRRSEAVLALMANAFNFAQFKAPGLVALAAITPRISAYRLCMGDLDTAVALVMEALGATDTEASLAGSA